MGSNRYVQFDPAVIEQARQIDLLSYLQRYEPSNLKRVAGNVYCTGEHDSLKISNGKWYWWSRGFGGYSALDYLMKVRELGFVEAVQTLTGDMGDWKPPPPAVKKDEPKVLLLPEKNTDCDKVTEYLFGRGIDYQLIQDCIAEGIIFEGRKYQNAVFVGRDKNGIPKYAALRSTIGSSFKGDASGSDKRYSFRLLAREPTDKVHLFEAAIDLLSYATYLKCEGKEPIVVRLYQEFLDGKKTDYIKRIFEKEGVRNWDGGTKWQATTLMSMLENEKYKGDALLQKSYTVDFLTKKRTQNKGEIQMFYVEDDHDAIISKRIWECVQLEIKRRKKYLEEHGTNSYSHRPESNPFASKIICGDCNKVFARKGWRSSTGVGRKVWQCSERYEVKGVMGCANRHVEEETLIKAYLMAWNALVENREDFMEQWTEQLQSENLLEGYRAEKFIEYTDGAEPLTEMDTDFMLKTLDHIKVFEDGTVLVVFLDGTEIECKNEEE